MGGLFRTGVRGISAEESVALDVLRVAAAMMVFLCHWDVRMNGGAFHLDVMGRVGVLIFFVLSGFLIAHSAQGQSARGFVVARLARLWSVAAPIVSGLMVLGFCVDMAWREIALTTVASLTFTNQWWFSNRPAISNAPYWTLSYEAAFYLVYGTFLYRGRRWGIAACLAVGPRVLLLLPVWLLGAAIYRTGFRLTRLGVLAAIPVAITLLIVFRGRVLGYIALPDIWKPSANFTRDWNHGLVCAGIVLAGLSFIRLGTLAPLAKWFAGRSFTLYLLHFPLLALLSPHLDKYVGAVLTLAICLAVGSVIEPHTERWRRMLNWALPQPPRQLPAKESE